MFHHGKYILDYLISKVMLHCHTSIKNSGSRDDQQNSFFRILFFCFFVLDPHPPGGTQSVQILSSFSDPNLCLGEECIHLNKHFVFLALYVDYLLLLLLLLFLLLLLLLLLLLFSI